MSLVKNSICTGLTTTHSCDTAQIARVLHPLQLPKYSQTQPNGHPSCSHAQHIRTQCKLKHHMYSHAAQGGMCMTIRRMSNCRSLMASPDLPPPHQCCHQLVTECLGWQTPSHPARRPNKDCKEGWGPASVIFPVRSSCNLRQREHWLFEAGCL